MDAGTEYLAEAGGVGVGAAVGVAVGLGVGVGVGAAVGVAVGLGVGVGVGAAVGVAVGLGVGVGVGVAVGVGTAVGVGVGVGVGTAVGVAVGVGVGVGVGVAVGVGVGVGVGAAVGVAVGVGVGAGEVPTAAVTSVRSPDVAVLPAESVETTWKWYSVSGWSPESDWMCVRYPKLSSLGRITILVGQTVSDLAGGSLTERPLHLRSRAADVGDIDRLDLWCPVVDRAGRALRAR